MARPKEFNRERVLDKAVDVFWCRGYEATSIQDLVDNLGINRQSIYDTFGDKYALFQAAFQRYQEAKVRQLEDRLAQPGSVKEIIRQVFQETVEGLLNDEPRRGCLVVNTIIELAPHDSAIATLAASNLKRNEAAFLKALQRAQAQGEFDNKPRDLQALARFLNSSMQGLGVTVKAIADRAVLQDIIKVALSVLD